MRSTTTFWIKCVLFLAGLTLFAWLVRSVGVRELLASFQQVGWPFLFLFVPYLVVYVLDAIGWQTTFHNQPRELGFFRLFLVRTAGESLNNTLPSAYLGGEPVKALLLRRFHVDMAEAASSVIAAKTTMTIAQILFIVLGFGAFFVAAERSMAVPGLLPGVLVLFSIGVCGVGVLVWWQRTGFTRPLMRLADNISVLARKLKRYEGALLRLDAKLAMFHSEPGGKFWVSIVWFLAGWTAGIFEVYLFGLLFDIPLSLLDALAIEALVTMVKAMAFVIPGSVGVQEGGIVLLFLAVGQTTLAGVSFSLVRRVRELIWIGFGFGLLGWYGWRGQGSLESLEK
jgi:putative membrane protein